MKKIILYLTLILSLIGLSFAGLGNFGNDANVIANGSTITHNPYPNGSRTLPVYRNGSNIKYLTLLNNYRALEKRFVYLQKQNTNLRIQIKQLLLNLSGNQNSVCSNLKERACISNSKCTPNYNLTNGRKGSKKTFQSCNLKSNPPKNVRLGAKPQVSITSNSVNIKYYLLGSRTNNSIFSYYNSQTKGDYSGNFTTNGNVNLGISNKKFKYQVSPSNTYTYNILSNGNSLYRGQFLVPQLKKTICSNLKERACISNSQCTPKYNLTNGIKGSKKTFQSCK